MEKFITEFITLTTQNWASAWNNKTFRRLLILGMLLIITACISTSFFFSYIEDSKEGVILNDWVLRNIPAIDVSIPIVILVTSCMLLTSIRCAPDPNLFITLIWAFVFQLIFRIITIAATRFYAPQGLIELKDPIGSLLYHSRFITRDLFYSGHTAFLFQFYLCSKKIKDKYYFLFCTVAVGILLLVQHVHYTVDVVTAPLFAFGCFWLSKRIILSQNAYLQEVE
jgi:hypothetical protein